MVRQLDDHVLPRLENLGAPALVVIGGSTGSGKSTLVNSLVGTEVSKPGVLHPDHDPSGPHSPSRRGTSLVVVLNRVPPGSGTVAR
jgi:putative ribosome biogenesis GTPase RsgA